MEVLVVEDDQRMAALLERGLRSSGHQVWLAHNGRDGLEFAELREYDVILLDVLLPLLDGLDLTQRLRSRGNRTPILMLTAKDSPKDAVRGLDQGADDYMTKPFAFEELLARLRAVSRRGPIQGDVVLKVGDLSLNTATHEVHRNHRAIELTPREFQILELMMRRSGRVVTRDSLIDAVWGGDSDVELNTVDVFVSTLRRKLGGSRDTEIIHTVRGIGFSIREVGS